MSTARVHRHVSEPSDWVRRFATLVPAGEVLDLACGSGRHARFFSGLGHRVLAIDRDAALLAQLATEGAAGLTTLQCDLEDESAMARGIACGWWPLSQPRFAGIVVANYLYRPLLCAIVGSLAPGGVLIYETFARGNERYGKPSNPDFLLRPGELLELAADPAAPLHVYAYEDLKIESPAPAMVQRLCARRSCDP